MAEEQRCQEGHRRCTNNCGFFGSPATLNLCSKCYRDYRLKEDQASSAKIAVEKSLLPSSSSSSSATVGVDAAPPSISAVTPEIESSAAACDSSPPSISAAATVAALAQIPANRCASCRKKVGLTGFRCRCGDTYCGAHRYPERHGCGFDFKAAGKEAIARANPVVKAAKLEKI